MRLLALDLATNTGWATCPFGDLSKTRSGSLNFPGSIGKLLIQFEAWLRVVLEGDAITHVAVEEAIPMRRATSSNAMKRLYGLHATLRKVCAEKEIEIADINVATWRKFFIGTSRAPAPIKKSKRTAWLKEQTMKECWRRGHAVQSADEADAVGVLHYVIAALGSFEEEEKESLFEAA